jgi:predicted RNase H-like HicB family nuclease
MKKSVKRKVYQYTAIFEPDPDVGGYTVTIPALPGCISEGDSFEEALNNVREAATLYVEVMHRRSAPRDRSVIVAPVQVAVPA